MTNTTKGKVSIILPVYNAELFVERSIKSVLDQTYSDVELIVVDDGSSDNTRKICERFAKKDNRVRIIAQMNRGVSAARNNGMLHASGAYISFLDADDYIENDAIETMVDLMKEKDVEIVRTHWQEIKSAQKYVGREHVEPGTYNIKEQVDLLRYEVSSGGMHSFVFLLLIKAELIKKNEIYFVEGVPMMEDACFYVDILKSATSVYISDHVTCNYVLHPESASRSLANFASKIQSVVKVDQYITRTGLKDSQICNIKASHISVVANMVTARVRSIFDRRQIKKLLQEVDGVDGTAEMYKAANLSFLDAYHRIEVRAVMHNRIFAMQILILLRKVLGK